MQLREPDWEGFGKAIMKYWPLYGIDGFDLQDLAVKYGILYKSTFFEGIDNDEYGLGIEDGDDWYRRNY